MSTTRAGEDGIERGAQLSPDLVYRYSLWRVWDHTKGLICFIMLNPSIADHEIDDPTIKKCMKFARRWGFGALEVVNLFPFRATDPKELKKLDYFTVLGPKYSDEVIVNAAREASMVVAAWGQNGRLRSRDSDVVRMLTGAGIKLYALKLAKNGTPYHPLYLKDNTQPFLWRE